MKVLQLAKYYKPFRGGMETVTEDITEGLVENSIVCDVLCSNDKFVAETVNEKGYKVYKTSSFGEYFSTSITPQLIGKLKRYWEKYDIIHVHLPNPMANLALFLTRPKAKIVVHWHSDIIKQEKLLRFYRPLQNWLLNRADRIIATSQKYIDGSKDLQKFKSKTSVIPIGIVDDKLSIDDNKVSEIKKRYKDKKIVFGLGRLAYYKGFEHLIKSAKFINDDIVILIGGKGKLKDRLEELIVDDGLADKVKLIGEIPFEELGSYFKACDLFCMSSIIKSEAFGVVLLEAMSFGKPIVATKIPGSGVDWVNQDGVTGINVEVENPKKIAEALNAITSDRFLYKELSDNCLKRFKNEFTKDKMVERVINLYNGLCR